MEGWALLVAFLPFRSQSSPSFGSLVFSAA
jgi:hypothetical protein